MADSFHATLDSNDLRLRLRHNFSQASYTPRQTQSVRPRTSQPLSQVAEQDSSLNHPNIEPLAPTYRVPIAHTNNSKPVANLRSLPRASQQPIYGAAQYPYQQNTYQEGIYYDEPYETNSRPKQGLKSKLPKLNTSKLTDFVKTKSKLQLASLSLAALMVIVGVSISYSAWSTNHSAAVAVSKLTSAANKADIQNGGQNSNSSQAISTVKPTKSEIANYRVAPELPMLLKIPSIKVDARVMQVNTLPSGALGTPSNVYDTAWYVDSAEPGEPGATLIDGHISSWTAHGVFYNLGKLVAGDKIQIEKGDGSTVNYQVVKTQTYGANNVDMHAAVTPINPTVSGLNLISCYGQVIKGTSLFNKRVIVFSEEIN